MPATEFYYAADNPQIEHLLETGSHEVWRHQPSWPTSIDRFIREAISKNASIIVANHPQGVHGFDNQTDDERSREIIRSAIDL